MCKTCGNCRTHTKGGVSPEMLKAGFVGCQIKPKYVYVSAMVSREGKACWTQESNGNKGGL